MGAPTDNQVEEAYRRYFPLILRKSERMLRGSSEAQDLAQETFLRLWQSRQDLRDASATTAWLYKTCTRLALDRLKSSARRAETAGDVIETMQSHAPGADDRSDQRRLLEDLCVTLPETELEVAVLSRVDGLNHAEIGKVLAVSARTVRRLLSRGDARLAKWRSRREVAA